MPKWVCQLPVCVRARKRERELGTSLLLQLSRFSARKIATLLPEILPNLTHSIFEELKTP
jgi:hypothetical protein